MRQKDRVYYGLGTHLEMLNDGARCLAYQKALEPVVKDKTVLDVGCGSGILSFFAARAGARRVLAVDMDVPPGAEETARINGLDRRVEFFTGRLQDIELPVDSVDVIVSEWMGGLLLMEDMLPVVLYARDRWLKPGGLLLPGRARLFLAPMNDSAGIDSREFPELRETISSQVWVSVIDPSRSPAEPACILDLDLKRIKETDVRSYESAFRFVIGEAGMLNGFGLWFDVSFGHLSPPVTLSTAPWLPPTHWAQALWVLPVDTAVVPGDEVAGTFSQVEITPSAASFRSRVSVWDGRGGGEKVSLDCVMKADPSNMNTPGKGEEELAERAMAGDYRGCDCFWIGCSMSFGALMAAGHGARRVSVLNHSPWAGRAMEQFAARQGLTNVRFLSGVPGPGEPRGKDIRLLGGADGSWQALVSHIRLRRILDRASFPVRFIRRESPWKANEFYGFDFSPYAAYDLEMYHEDGVFSHGPVLEDVTGEAVSPGPGREKEDSVYAGMASGGSSGFLSLPDGFYNNVKISFECGSVVLPLPGLSGISSTGKRLQTVELTVSVFNRVTCRFMLTLSGPGWSLERVYEQPMVSMGHIVR